MKNQKGITLIALIITIIVMLILVGVTVNIALNGGLFTKADDAKESTQLAMDKEELQMEIVTAYDEDNKGVDLETLKDNLEKKGWKDIIITGDKLTCTSPNGNTFTVDGKGKVEEVPENDDDDDDDDDDKSTDLERYLFNEDGTGKTGLLTMNENTKVITFVDDSNTIADASTSIIYMNNGSENGEYYVVIEYKGADYKVNVTGFNFATAAAEIGSDKEKVTKLPTIYDGTDDETKIKQYFLGYSGTGKYFMSIVDIELSEQKQTTVFKNNNIISDASESISILGQSGSAFSIKYNENTYVITVNNSSMTIQSVTPLESKTYPAVYSLEETIEDGSQNELNVTTHIIELSDLEVIVVFGLAAGGQEQFISARYENVRACTNIKEAKSKYSNISVSDLAGIPYDQVAVNPSEDIVLLLEAFVYFPSVDAWGIVQPASYSGQINQMTIKEPTIYRNNSMTQEQINEYIELANQQQS